MVSKMKLAAYAFMQDVDSLKFRSFLEKDLPAEELEDKILLYKFLKARNFNIKQAEAMFRKNIRWRKAMQVDSILTDFKPRQDLSNYVSHRFLGYDKEGCPISYLGLGDIDNSGLLRVANSLNIIRYVIRDVEFMSGLLKSQSKKLGRQVTQVVLIYDMKNLSFARATHRKSLETLRQGLIIFQDNYPERLKSFFIINASVYFAMAFPFFKAVLANEVFKKMLVFSEAGWREELLKIIDADKLPDFCGGTLPDVDGILNFETIGLVPTSYYSVKDIEEMARREGSNYLKVERRRSVQIPLKIHKPRSIIHWEFLIKNNDIGFGLMLDSPNDESIFELIPVHKLETEVEPECYFYRCEKAGDYKMVFDNTYSWFNSKELYYRIWVTNDEDKYI